MSETIKLRELHPLEYEHPFDANALDALEQTPGVSIVVRQYYKQAVERTTRILYTGSFLRITSAAYPNIYEALDEVCETINLPVRPELYLAWDYRVGAFTTGVDHPIIVLNSGTIDLLNETELRFVVGHEVGHIKSKHILYQAVASLIPYLAEIAGQATFGIANLVSLPVRSALLRWQRMSEFTADRAGLLACQDGRAAATGFMKLAGMPLKYQDSMVYETFIQQARDFEHLDDEKLNKVFKYLVSTQHTHPWTVMRAAELIRWVESDDYQKVIDRKTLDRIGRRTEGENQYSCRACGYRLDEEASFCSWCGANLKGETPESAIEQAEKIDDV